MNVEDIMGSWGGKLRAKDTSKKKKSHPKP